MSELQTRFDELSADLQANRNELSSKTKQLVELQNEVGSMQSQVIDKNREIEQLRISSKLSSQQRSDEMHLEIEAYKNQLQLRESEKAELYNNHMGLQRQFQQLKASYDALSFKSQQNDGQYQMNTARLHSMYKQRMDSLNRMHATQSKTYESKLEAIKQEQYVLSNKETEDIVNSINELRTTHDQIESDLNAQIEDLKDQMMKREQEKERLIEEMKTLQSKAHDHFEAQVQELQTKLAQFEDGEIEIVLKIEVDDPVLSKPPPRKPAPLRPAGAHVPSTIITTQHTSQHSRQSSAASSTRAQNDHMLSLSPLAGDSFGANNRLSLKNVEVNSEFWSGDHSDPSSGHHDRPKSQGNSALSIIKSIWTPQPRSTGGPSGARRMVSTPGPAYSTGFPSTSGFRRKNSSASVASFNSDFFDNLSVASASSPYGMAAAGHKHASSVQLSPTDAIQSKSLELQKEMYRQANNRLAEDLKNANKKVMVIKQQSYRKHKELQLQLQAEQRQWKLREKEISDRLDEKRRLILQNEQLISSFQQKYKALQAEVNMHIQSGNSTPTQHQQQQQQQQKLQHQAQTNSIMMKLQSLEQNNKSLITELEKYRAELSRSKQTVLGCTTTMRKQQEQILVLNTRIAELRKLSGLGGSSSEELLQKQIRLLKSQRRMLVKELKELREQNEKLKNIIVTGATPTTIAAGQAV